MYLSKIFIRCINLLKYLTYTLKLIDANRQKIVMTPSWVYKDKKAYEIGELYYFASNNL